jgi:hypothetical protein
MLFNRSKLIEERVHRMVLLFLVCMVLLIITLL